MANENMDMYNNSGSMNGNPDMYNNNGSMNGNPDVYNNNGSMNGNTDVYNNNGSMNGNPDMYNNNGSMNGNTDVYNNNGSMNGDDTDMSHRKNTFVDYSEPSLLSSQWYRLPWASREFSQYKFAHGNRTKALDATNSAPNAPYRCDEATKENALFNWDAHSGDHQQFIFFQMDDGRFAISDKSSGRVLEWFTVVGGYEICSAYWTGNYDQQWTQRYVNPDQFVLINGDKQMIACGSGINSRVKISTINPNLGNPYSVLTPTSPYSTIRMPVLPNKEPLPAVPIITSLNQVPPAESVKAISGGTLVPCIMVNDPAYSASIKIKDNPYYVLVKRQYWKRLWTYVFPPGYEQKFTEKTGISSTTQTSIKRTVNMSINADFKPGFLPSLEPIKLGVTAGLETTITQTNTELRETILEETYKNPNTFDTAWVRYALATELELIRPYNNTSVGKWSYIDNTVKRDQSYPPQQTLELTDSKIISTDSYRNIKPFAGPILIES